MKKIFTLIIVLASTYIMAQCDMDRHSTSWYDGWLSCKKAMSPNPQRGNSHWIMYTLGNLYELNQTHFWNHNEPLSLNDGASEIILDYSLDGIEWMEWGTFNLEKANGLKNYSGQIGPNLSGIKARFLLFTINRTYGGSCAGLGEFKANVNLITSTKDEALPASCFQTEIYPNPFSDIINIKIIDYCSEKPARVQIQDAVGRIVQTAYFKPNKPEISINTSILMPGVYFLNIDNGQQNYFQKIIKVD